MKIVIIEDEKLTAKDLARTLSNIDASIEVVATLHSLRQAFEFMRTNPEVDLIFSDIELGDGLSFELFEQLKIKSPVIFCTAYDKYALEAFHTFSIDYILKPFTRQSVEKALQKYLSIKENMAIPQEDHFLEMIHALKSQLIPKNPAVLIQQGDKIIPLFAKDIALFYAENEYSFAYTFAQESFLVSPSLEALSQQFGTDFFRINRQFLVNRLAIKDAAHHLNRKIMVNLKIPFKAPILVGKLKITAFLNWWAGK